jgi:hypothetical protein
MKDWHIECLDNGRVIAFEILQSMRVKARPHSALRKGENDEIQAEGNLTRSSRLGGCFILSSVWMLDAHREIVFATRFWEVVRMMILVWRSVVELEAVSQGDSFRR